jgi:hypothetical protein
VTTQLDPVVDDDALVEAELDEVAELALIGEEEQPASSADPATPSVSSNRRRLSR